MTTIHNTTKRIGIKAIILGLVQNHRLSGLGDFVPLQIQPQFFLIDPQVVLGPGEGLGQSGFARLPRT
jgi:hypothetical protein